MSGDESEIIYVFNKDVNVATLESAVEDKFAEDNTWDGWFISVASNNEKAVEYIAENYALRGAIAGFVMIVLVYVYSAIRFGIGKGVSVALGTFYGLGLTIAIVILTRIPVTASIGYVFAMAALLSAITSVMTMNKIAANEKAENGCACACACKEIGAICGWTCAALLVLAIFATKGVTCFALTSIIAVIVATLIGLKGVPALYAPIKAAADAKPSQDAYAYVGAVKTSTKEKKVFAKKETVEVAPVEETVEEVAEEPAEETVEEVAEVAEEPVEEAVEEVTEEPVEEVAEDATEEVTE